MHNSCVYVRISILVPLSIKSYEASLCGVLHISA